MQAMSFVQINIILSKKRLVVHKRRGKNELRKRRLNLAEKL